MEQSKPLRKPGELGFSILALLFGALGYYFAMDMTSGELSSPSVLPKLASVVIMAMAAISFFRAMLGKKKVTVNFMTLTTHLFSRDVVVLLILLAFYSLALPILHFPIASFVFLFIALTYLQRLKRIPMCFGIALVSIAALVAIFTYVFKVQLP